MYYYACVRVSVGLRMMVWSSCGCSVLPLLLLLTSHAVPVVLSETLQLELASVVYRHGDRSPVGAYPKDKYQESYWPQGFGQLSITGMQQQYFLGGVLRDRYVNRFGLITPNYTRIQVYVRSTDYDRTLMSAEAQLAGLFPPEGDQVFNASIPWQPIPVHTVPRDEDMLLRAYAEDCPRYKLLREEDERSPEYVAIEEKNEEFFRELEDLTGQMPVTLANVWMIQDTLLIQGQNGLEPPLWLTDAYWKTLTELATYTLGLMFSSTEKSRLSAGVWVGKVLDDMLAEVENPQQNMKLYLYSAHDTTVAAMETALGVYNNILPPYAAAFFIELYSDATGDYFVSLFYRNDTESDDLLPLSLDSCVNPTLCTLEEFTKVATPVIPVDWERECQVSSDNGSNINGAAVALGVFLGLALIALVVLAVLLLVVLRHVQRSRRLNAAAG